MNPVRKQKTGAAFASLLILCFSAGTLTAQSPPNSCVEMGALAWDDWTTADAGGSGKPTGESESDYLRCKSCHGWDRLGTDGGYVRRKREAGRPNAGAGDSDMTSRNISTGLGNIDDFTAADILHEQIGRSYSDGSGSWVPLNPDHIATNKTDHARGYTLGNQHPDFGTGGINAGDTILTLDQAVCLAEFINSGHSKPGAYFTYINTLMNPVLYTINPGGSNEDGKAFYDRICLACHGEPAIDHDGSNGGHPNGGILAYLARDGKFSELVHKARWGIPDTVMTRSVLDYPDANDMINLLTYLQEAGATGFAITGGISGTWWDAERDGEGFLIDVAPRDAGWVVVASYYAYNDLGEQLWLNGSGVSSGNSVVVNAQITDGGSFGTDFNKDDVNKDFWGDIEMEFSSCGLGHVTLRPTQDMLDAGLGFEIFDFDINRLTPANTCP